MTEQQLQQKFEAMSSVLGELGRRRWAATEANALGRGGLTLVSKATGISIPTIRKGIAELASGAIPAETRQRSLGGGRKSIASSHPKLLKVLEALVSPATRGDPESNLKWTSKSTEKLAAELRGKKYDISADTVGRLLIQLGYSLQSVRKSHEGGTHPDRDQQFQHIALCVKTFQDADQPVISVDTKKKELVGAFKNGGREHQPQKTPVKVNVYDFPDLADGKAIPYGVYDVTHNEAWVSVGTDHDTPAFAVSTIRQWWVRMGKKQFPDADRLMITADSGGSNSSRAHQWKLELQGLANETGLEIQVSHFPPGTSKWNKIEHRLFGQISINWRGRPLESFEVIVNLIANTRTRQGLRVKANLDEGDYPLGRKATKEQLAKINIARAVFHPEWNYVISPNGA